MSSMQILLLIALAPAFGLLVFVYKKDKLEKEPKKFILRLVLLGAASTTLAMITETIGELILSNTYYSGSMDYLIIDNFIVVALSEEGFKFLMLKIHTWKNKNFDCQYDGVVYAVAVSLGFAALENVLYVVEYGFGTGILRAFTAIPGHTSFAALMGVFYGFAKKYNNEGEKGIGFLFNVLAVFVPVLAHGTYDFLATAEETAAFLVFIIALFIICFVLIQVLSKKDHYFAGMEPAPGPIYGSYMNGSVANPLFTNQPTYEQLPYARPVSGGQVQSQPAQNAYGVQPQGYNMPYNRQTQPAYGAQAQGYNMPYNGQTQSAYGAQPQPAQSGYNATPQSSQPAQQASQVMSFCHNCGAKNTGNKFCMNCGQILVK